MIPILYDALEKDFSTNGIGLLTDAESCIVTEERNGIYELVLTYPAKGHLADHITEDMIIKAKANDEDKPQLFRIYKSGKAIGNNITWYAEHVRYELNGNPIENFKISGANADMALRTILGMAVLPHDFTSTSDIQTANSTEIEGVVSVGNALGGTAGSILDVWGGEYHFDNYIIELKKQRGQDNGVTIEYGKNLIDAKQEKNIADIATVIFPYAKYHPEGEDQEKYISLTEKILIHKDAKNFATMRCTNVDFSQEWESGTIVTEDMLRTKATEYLNKISTEPKISITLSFAALKKTKDYKNLQAFEKVKLCDTVTVKILPLGISAKAKITKVKYDSIKERYESLEIGETRTNLTKSITAVEKEAKELIIRNQTRTEKIKAEIEKTIKNVTEAITGNSGGHVVLYPSQNPQEIMILDKGNINEAKNVWRWNLAGLGHSSTGVNGTFTTAITADGQIVANFITTGELTGTIIKAGTVAAEALDVEYRESVKKYSQETANAALSSAKEDTTNRLKSYSTTEQMNAAIKTTADSITQTVSKTYVTTATYEGGISAAAKDATTKANAALSSAQEDATTKANAALSSAKEDTTNRLKSYSTTEQMNAAIKTTADSITQTVSKTYVTTATYEGGISAAAKDATTKANAALSSAKEDTTNRLKSYSTTEQMNAAIKTTADSITQTVSKTYVTTATYEGGISAAAKDATTKANAALSSAKEDTTNRLKSYSTTVQMNAAIKTTADAITQTVSKKVGTDEIISKINQTAETITINASKINFNGMITANNRFKILSDGSFEANYGKIANWDVRSDYIESRSVGGVTTKLYANGSIAFGDCTISTYGGAFTIRNGLHIYTSTNTVNGFDDGTERFKVYGLEHVTSGGHLVFGSDGATVSYLSSSSKRYKDHVKDMTIEEAEKILEVPVVWFKYKEGYLNATDWLNGKELPGFYAEDIYNIFPQATQLNENGEPEDWNYRVLIPAMLKLIQELYKEKEQKG